jgi:small conductance mechanosensitive channel
MENAADLEKTMSYAIETGMNVITTYGFKVIGAVIILIVGWTAAGIVKRAIVKAGTRSERFDKTLVTFFASISKYAVLTFTVIAVLGSFGVETTSFVAVLGALGFALGLALQGTLGHVASGIMLVIFRPFRIGDFIEAGGVMGTVDAITLFTTEVNTPDNVRVIVPNGAVWGGVVKNFASNPTRRLDFTIGIAYEDNIDKAMGVLRNLVDAEPRILKDPAPMLAVRTLADSSVNLLARVWTARGDLFDVNLALNKTVKETFDKEGISIPYPQQVVHRAPADAPTAGH